MCGKKNLNQEIPKQRHISFTTQPNERKSVLNLYFLLSFAFVMCVFLYALCGGSGYVGRVNVAIHHGWGTKILNNLYDKAN